MISQQIKNDAQPVVFEALTTKVRNLIAELKRDEKFDEMSITFQNDAGVFIKRKQALSDEGSKNALQKLYNILKASEEGTGQPRN